MVQSKHVLIDQIKKLLFKPEERRLIKELDRIVDLHDEAHRSGKMGFIYEGENYRSSRATVIYRSYPMLTWAYNDLMEKYLKDKKQVETDRQLIGQTLFKLLYQANDRQEIRDTLPECIVSLIGDFSDLPRRYEQGFIIRHNEHDYAQFKKILPKIEMYAISGLIY